MSHRVGLILAAAVCMIDEIRIPFARNRGELDAIYDRLDEEGLNAAARAFKRLNPPPPEQDEDPLAEPKDPLDDAKN